MSKSHPPQLNPSNPQVGHESRDVPIGGVLYFLIALVCIILLTMVFLWWFFGVLSEQISRTDPPPPPLAGERTPPLGPRLQSSPAEDMHELRAEEAEMLHTYRWISPAEQIVRIPIERAIDLVAEQGLPDWPAPAGGQQPGTQPPNNPQPNGQQQGNPQQQPGTSPQQPVPAGPALQPAGQPSAGDGAPPEPAVEVEARSTSFLNRESERA